MAAYFPYILLAIVAGVCVPVQAGINARLNLWTASPVLAATISFAVGTVGLVMYALIMRIPLPPLSASLPTPFWVWTGGLLGAFFVASTIILAPKLGATTMLAALLAGQMVSAILLDHFGLLGFPVHPISLLRIIGVILVFAGILLIRH